MSPFPFPLLKVVNMYGINRAEICCRLGKIAFGVLTRIVHPLRVCVLCGYIYVFLIAEVFEGDVIKFG